LGTFCGSIRDPEKKVATAGRRVLSTPGEQSLKEVAATESFGVGDHLRKEVDGPAFEFDHLESAGWSSRKNAEAVGLPAADDCREFLFGQRRYLAVAESLVAVPVLAGTRVGLSCSLPRLSVWPF
jgi:hypothetical protein